MKNLMKHSGNVISAMISDAKDPEFDPHWGKNFSGSKHTIFVSLAGKVLIQCTILWISFHKRLGLR